ncbi:anti-sigma regulatory factor (Ser/Thr protein kinase) [Actinomadura coerulea]|uniref:Anti-sigma regulatory factor (Ser/Thr protein kinase) n=1 Tax=Actinomadura coerulea TaxID=46159 RepID=A0A7X0L2W2_9ACTN|nr:ATP-binding protein [Actinomadura coerulea]MBB6399990.1 anti-sigma regulatory factor (Ser/Thr protein kinase) [Actinomadura coerulea]GGQ17455.1 ATP-binding protein [Actinomadura coerulea]
MMSGDHHTIELPSTPLPSHLTTTATPVAPPNGTAPNGPRGLDEPPVVLLGELTLPAERASVPAARRFSRSVSTASGVGHIADDAEVLVSELVTNAVRHAPAAGGALCLRLLRAGARLRIEVHDQSAAVPTARPVDLMEETGRGWFLVAVMADRHGTEHTASGKAVWCEVRAWPRDEHPGH